MSNELKAVIDGQLWMEADCVWEKKSIDTLRF